MGFSVPACYFNVKTMLTDFCRRLTPCGCDRDGTLGKREWQNMCTYGKVTGSCRKLHNEKLRNLHSSMTTIINLITAIKIWCGGHVARIRNEKCPLNCSSENTERTDHLRNRVTQMWPRARRLHLATADCCWTRHWNFGFYKGGGFLD